MLADGLALIGRVGTGFDVGSLRGRKGGEAEAISCGPAARRFVAKGHGLAWFLAGALAGGLVTWVMLGRDPAAEQVRATVERTVGHSVGIDTTTPPPKPKFEFYTLLPEHGGRGVPMKSSPAPGPAPDAAPAEQRRGGHRSRAEPPRSRTTRAARRRLR